MNRSTQPGIPIQPSEITPEQVYLSRRNFIKLGATALGTAVLAACGLTPPASTLPKSTPQAAPSGARADDLGGELTPFEIITHYNNYYEFTTDKEGVAPAAARLKTAPWTVEIGGLVANPTTYAIEDLLKKYPSEERIYRLRCVEGWSMVIPWMGFPLARLLKEVQPKSEARYVRFQTLLRPEEMPGQLDPLYPWPYQEGLRLDEAMNDLTILSTGLYGKPLLPQNGAPLRLVVPWKYGFKSIKSIVKIELTAEQPATLWSAINAEEYGFYSNVNPERPHPRWSQATERRIGELSRRPTLMFNGYADQVAGLYQGMDLIRNY